MADWWITGSTRGWPDLPLDTLNEPWQYLLLHLDFLKEQRGKLKAAWRATENNRRAKYYCLTAAGRRQLEQQRARWNRVSFAVASVLEGA